MACLSFIFRKRKPSPQQSRQHIEGIPGNITIYTYKELKSATDDFSSVNKVGEGGFGSVYKGRLKDGKNVAIKVLSSESRQGAKEFLAEISVISNIKHENLVTLHGCCVDDNHRILVYNYLENNSLAQTLFASGHSSIHFNWKTRSKIVIGVARGLAFLHEEVRPHIVHRDIKASNVLLDRNLMPKISDFGLAKLLPPNMTHVSTRVAGTIGYLAPEYAVRGQVSRKSDVYSFGVLLLEIVSGRCNTSTMSPFEDQLLLEQHPDITNGLLLLQTWALHERGELEKIVDASLTGDLDIQEALMFLKVGLLCTQDSAKLRPPMSSVVKMLTGDYDVTSAKITKPGVITDFMELKVRSQRRPAEASTSSNESSVFGTTDIMNTSSASMSFTNILERD